MQRAKKVLITALCAAFWLAVWQIAALLAAKPAALPSFTDVLLRLIELAKTAVFWKSAAMTLARILAGFSLAVVSGALLSAAGGFVPAVRYLFSPLLSVIRATPVASFILLALIWMSKGTIPSFTAFLMVLPIIWGAVNAGIDNPDREMLEVARIFRFSRIQKLRHIYFPSVRSHFLSGIKTSLGLAWKAGVAAEVLCTPKLSIGKSMYDAKVYIESADLFAWTVTVVVLSFILEKSFEALTGKLSHKYSEAL